MSERSPNSSSAGRAVAGLLAAGLVAAVAQASAWAGEAGDRTQDKRKEKAEARRPAAGRTTDQSATKPAPAPAAARQPVTRSVGGAQVAIDPASGRLRPPTAEEAQLLAKALNRMLSRESDDLPVVQLPNGTLMVDLQDTFQDVAMATKDRRGRARLVCVNQPAAAEALLNGTLPVGDEAGEPGPRRGKNSNRKPAKSAAEKE